MKNNENEENMENTFVLIFFVLFFFFCFENHREHKNISIREQEQFSEEKKEMFFAFSRTVLKNNFYKHESNKPLDLKICQKEYYYYYYHYSFFLIFINFALQRCRILCSCRDLNL